MSVSVGSEEVLDRLAAHDPLLGLSWGRPVSPLPSLDPDWWSTRRALWGDAAKAGDPLLAAVANAEIVWHEHGEHLRCVHATVDSPVFAVRQCLDEMPLANTDDIASYAEVLATVPVALRGLEGTLRSGIAGGQTAAVRQAIATAKAAEEWSAAALVDRVAPLVRTALGATLAGELERRADAAARAFSGIAQFLRDEYAVHAREADAVGAETYDVCASRHFLERPRLEWFEWATDEMERVLAALRAARHEVERGEPSLQVVGAAAHREWCQAFVETAAVATTSLVPLPEGELAPVVELMPAGGIGSYAAYYSPPKTASVRGTVWIAPDDGPHYVEYEKVLLAHEGVPGHHTESLHQRRAASLTPFQRVANVPVHSEGWGLYAEHLADEAGLYDTPHSRAGYLGSLALRVASLLIDMGIHRGLTRRDGLPWTVAGAGDVLTEVGLDADVASSWLDNILGRPGHRSTFAVGKLGWMSARAAAQSAGLSPAEFHVSALGRGPSTFDTLRTGDHRPAT